MVALYLTLASVTGLYCLLGYWMAFGKQYWLWRAAAVCIALALLVPIRAYEPLVFFGMTSLLFVATAAGRHLYLWWRESRRKKSAGATPVEPVANRPSFQFRLHDLLGLTAVIGVAAWMIPIILREEVIMPWLGAWLAAVFCAAITLAVATLVKGPKRLIPGSVLILLVGCLVVAFRFDFRPITSASFCVVGDYLGSYLFDYLFAYYPWHSALIVFELLVLFVLFLAFGFGIPRALQRASIGSSEKRIWQSLAAAVLALCFVVYGWLYFQILSFPQRPSQDHQQTNSLPRILERGERIEFVPHAQARVIAADVLALTRQPGYIALPWNGTYSERRKF